jgi:hypothetical protein
MGTPTDYLYNLSINGNELTFSYKISDSPDSQWWVIYRGVMPSWQYINKDKLYWDWISNHSQTAQEGTITYNYSFNRGEIYTIALFRNNNWGLADYREIIA